MPAAVPIIAAVAGSVVSSMLNKKDSAPAPAAAPTVAAPTPMGSFDPTREEAKRTSIVEQLRRRGRASTILTDNETVQDTLG